ncbi:MAG: hypothetical protein GY755_19905 [Chloroflexi bacterium]|nr:hypothetical protein [Chloroflexota bacterium]
MPLLDKLEKKLYKYSIPDITIALIIGQVIFFFLQYFEFVSLEDMTLIGREVFSGQYWRLFSFLFIPVTDSLLWAFFAWYLYYLYGTALEGEWGAFRYNVYILLSYIFTLVVAFIFPDTPLTNTYLYLSIFLAFAYLYPDFKLHLFFFIPVAVKWLALIQWIGYAFILLFGTWAMRILVLASIGNFLIFFGKDLVLRVKHGQRKKRDIAKKEKRAEKPFHVCFVCGLTDKEDPKMDFRYCSHCDYKCYCMDHLATHECQKE